MKIKKTYTELFELNTIGGAYIQKHPGDKLSEGIAKFFNKQIKAFFEDYNDKLDDLQRDNCLVDNTKHGAIIKDEKGGRMYSIEGEKSLKAAVKKLNEETVELNTRIVENISGLIPFLTDAEKEAFSGLLIPIQPILEEGTVTVYVTEENITVQG